MWILSPATLGCLAIILVSSCSARVEYPAVLKSDHQTPSLGSSEQAPILTYRYDSRRDDCVNTIGEAGLNLGHLGECGQVADLNLEGQDLSHRSFAGLRAKNVNWAGAILKNTTFQGAWIVDSSFEGADLSDAVFRTTLLENSILKNANLSGADFRNSTWESMDGDHLQGATLSSTSHLPGSIEDYENLGLRLTEADLQQEYLVGFDEGLSPLVRNWVALDIQRLTRLKIQTTEDSAFARAFGGTTQESLLRYFFSRISAIVRPGFKNFELHSEDDSPPADLTRIEPPQSSTLASNLGTALLIENIYTKNKHGLWKSALVAGQSILPAPGSNGILMLGPGYTRSESDQILRLTTLVHEARHTDCPIPPTAEALAPLIETESRTSGLSSLQCGYFHIPCPKGSELEGILACDDRFDGAYGVASAFGQALDLSCENCSERERARARITWLENKNRIFPKFNEELSGSGSR